MRAPYHANDVRARGETTSGAVVVLAEGYVTDKKGDGDFKKGERREPDTKKEMELMV